MAMILKKENDKETVWMRGYGFTRKDEAEELQGQLTTCPITLTWDEALGKTPIPEEKKKAIREYFKRGRAH